MAQLALGLTGAAAGFFLTGGSPIGTAIGFSSGLYLAGVLFPPQSTQIGPQVDDLKITSSTYGKLISRTYGTDRISGNLIWATDIVEVRNESTEGGKNVGPQVTTVGFSYFANASVCFGEGDLHGAGTLSVLKLLGDGKIMRDWTGEGPVGENGTVRVYEGTLTQQPDSLIEETEGVGRAPGFRGLCHVVYELYPLADHGNRFPNVEAIVSRNPADNKSVLAAAGETDIGKRAYYSREQGILYGNNDDGVSIFAMMSSSGPTLLGQYDTVSNTDPDIDNGVIFGNNTHSWAIDAEHKYFYRHGGNGNYSPLYQIDVRTGRVFQQQGGDGPVAGQFPSADVIDVRKDYTKLIPTSAGTVLPERLIFKSELFGGINMMFLPTFVSDFKAEPFLSSLSGAAIRWAVLDDNLIGWVLLTGTTTTGLHKLDPSVERDFETGGPLISVPETPTDHGIQFDLSGTFTEASTEGRDEAVMAYIKSFHALLIRRGTNLALFDIASETIIQFDADAGPALSIDPKTWYSWARSGVAGDGLLGVPTGSTPGTIGLLDLNTFEYTITYDLNDWVAGINWIDGAYESRIGGFVVWDEATEDPNEAKALYIRDSAAGQTLDFILDAEITLGSMETAELTLTDASSITIDGYTVARVAAITANIQQLLDFSFIDLIRADDKLVAVARGGSIVKSILEDDLGAYIPGDEPPKRWNRTRRQETNLPVSVSLTYKSEERDFKNDNQRYARTFEVTDSDEEGQFTLAIVMDADTARQWCQKTLSVAWTERNFYETTLGYKWLRLLPSDVVNVTNKGVIYRVRIIEADFGSNYIIAIQAVDDHQDSYNAPITGDAGSFPVLKGLEISIESIIFLIDNAPLRGGDMDLGTYMGVSPLYAFGGTYRGAFVRESIDDGGTFDLFTAITSATSYGIVTEPLPDADFRFWDRVNSLTVQWTFGSLPSSVTEAQALDGQGAYAIGNNTIGYEIVNVVSVVANADGSFTFDILLRGRAGSQALTRTHVAGEYIIPLSATNITRRATSGDRLNVTRIFRADTIGSPISNTTSTFINTGRAVRPQAPSGLRAHRTTPLAAGITLDWRRTTGINGEAWWNAISLPVGDAYSTISKYDVEILDGPSGSVALTKTDVAAETLSLTSDEINPLGLAEETFVQDLQLTMLNPGFETGTTDPANWTDITSPPANPDALTELDFGGGRVISPFEGSQFLLCSQDLVGPGDENLIFINDIIDLISDGVSAVDIDAGKVSVQFKCRMLMTNANETFQVGFRFWDTVASGGNMLSEQFGTVYSLSTIDIWTEVEFFMNIPATTRGVEGKIFANDSRNVLVDDCEMWTGQISPRKVDVKIYQKSDIYGRGQTREESLLVSGSGAVR